MAVNGGAAVSEWWLWMVLLSVSDGCEWRCCQEFWLRVMAVKAMLDCVNGDVVRKDDCGWWLSVSDGCEWRCCQDGCQDDYEWRLSRMVTVSDGCEWRCCQEWWLWVTAVNGDAVKNDDCMWWLWMAMLSRMMTASDGCEYRMAMLSRMVTMSDGCEWRCCQEWWLRVVAVNGGVVKNDDCGWCHAKNDDCECAMLSRMRLWHASTWLPQIPSQRSQGLSSSPKWAFQG
jgi:hypothetical protein